MILDVTTTASCANDGTATVVATGGAEPYTYSWSPVPSTLPTIVGLSEGNYLVTVTDNDGNVQTAIATIISGMQNFLINANICLAEMGNRWVTDRSYGREQTNQEEVELLKHWIDILKCL